MVMLPLAALSQGERKISLILSNCVSSFSGPSRPAVPGRGCSVADRFLNASGFSRDAPFGRTGGSAVAPHVTPLLPPHRFDGLWEGATSFQLSLQQLFPARELPDSSGAQIPEKPPSLLKSSFFPLF